LEDGRFWTDGAILARRTTTLRPTEAVICLDGDIDSLLTPGERIIQAFFFFNVDIIWFPLVLMISENCFMTFLPDYIDYVITVGTSARREAQYFLSENKKGCVLLGNGPEGYVSRFEVSSYVNEQIESLVRNLYASKICRY
jgi:hypothetical protein